MRLEMLSLFNLTTRLKMRFCSAHQTVNASNRLQWLLGPGLGRCCRPWCLCKTEVTIL